MKKRIPYAVANFEKLIGEQFFFVDKTRFIRELEKYQVPVFLRPRRFGKSLWCSLLECSTTSTAATASRRCSAGWTWAATPPRNVTATAS